MKFAVPKHTFCVNSSDGVLVPQCLETPTGRDAKMYMPRCIVIGNENRNVPRTAHGIPMERHCGDVGHRVVGVCSMYAKALS